MWELKYPLWASWSDEVVAAAVGDRLAALDRLATERATVSTTRLQTPHHALYTIPPSMLSRF